MEGTFSDWPDFLRVRDMDTWSAVSHPHCSLQHPDMSLCRHSSPTEEEKWRGEQWGETRWKTNIQCKLFKQPQSLECFQWRHIGRYCSARSGDPKWKPTVARQSSEVWKEESWWWGVWSYWAKVEWAEIRHKDFWINVLQIPREVLALQPCTEVHAFVDLSKGPLLEQ